MNARNKIVNGNHNICSYHFIDAMKYKGDNNGTRRETSKTIPTMISKRRVEVFFALGLLLSIQGLVEARAEIDPHRYLQQFGYTPQVEGRRLFSVVAKSSYTEGILKLQRLYKLPVSTTSMG